MDFYLVQEWNVGGQDCEAYVEKIRIAAGIENIEQQRDPVVIPESEFHQFWHPDTWFPTAKKQGHPSDVIATRLMTFLFDRRVKACRMKLIAA